MIAFFFLYGFVLLLGLIGILNVMSTEMSQVRMRAREFAVLRSIGMTSEDLEKMLHLESVLCAGISAHVKNQNLIETIRM